MEMPIFVPPGLEPPTGAFIKEKLEERGCEYSYKLWKELVEARKEKGNKYPSYDNFYGNYIWKLKELELIEEVEPEDVPDYEPGYGISNRTYYQINPKKEDSDCWNHVQFCYDPLTGLGREDYRELKEEAEEKGVSIEDLYIEKHYDEIEKVAEELDISTEKVEKRVRESRKFKKID